MIGTPNFLEANITEEGLGLVSEEALLQVCPVEGELREEGAGPPEGQAPERPTSQHSRNTIYSGLFFISRSPVKKQKPCKTMA